MHPRWALWIAELTDLLEILIVVLVAVGFPKRKGAEQIFGSHVVKRMPVVLERNDKSTTGLGI